MSQPTEPSGPPQPPQPPGTPTPPAPPGGEPGSPSSPASPPAPPRGMPSPPSSSAAGGGGGSQPGWGGEQPSNPGYGAAPQSGSWQPGASAGGQLSQQEERTWGMLAHASAILAATIGLSFIGPLVVLLVQGPKSQFVRRQSIEALNFQITTYIAAIISAILIIVLIGFVLLIVVGLLWLIFTILASVAANRGEDYRYPLNWRLIK